MVHDERKQGWIVVGCASAFTWMGEAWGVKSCGGPVVGDDATTRWDWCDKKCFVRFARFELGEIDRLARRYLKDMKNPTYAFLFAQPYIHH